MIMCAKFYRNKTFNFKVMMKKPISDEKIRISLRHCLSEIQNFSSEIGFLIITLKLNVLFLSNFAHIIMRTLLMFSQINTNKQCYLGSGHTILMWSTRKIVLFQMYFLDSVK